MSNIIHQFMYKSVRKHYTINKKNGKFYSPLACRKVQRTLSYPKNEKKPDTLQNHNFKKAYQRAKIAR